MLFFINENDTFLIILALFIPVGGNVKVLPVMSLK